MSKKLPGVISVEVDIDLVELITEHMRSPSIRQSIIENMTSDDALDILEDRCVLDASVKDRLRDLLDDDDDDDECDGSIDYGSIDYKELAYEYYHGKFDVAKLFREIGIGEIEKIVSKM